MQKVFSDKKEMLSNGLTKRKNQKKADVTVLQWPEYICPHGSLDLMAKQEPIYLHPYHKDPEKAKRLHEKIWCCERGEIDVSILQKKLMEGGERIWSNKLAAETKQSME